MNPSGSNVSPRRLCAGFLLAALLAGCGPAPDAGPDSWFDYVYLRENPRGGYEEYWHHTAGCRRWLVVCRDTVTHEVRASRDAAAAKGQAA